MPLQLHFGPGACSFVPHALLESAGADYMPQLVKLHKGEQYGEAFKAINPRSQVPVLVTEDGTVLTQIVAIVDYLAARFPEQHYLPTEPLARAQALSTLCWMNSAVHASFTHIFMPQKFTDDEALHAPLRRFATAQFARQLGEIEALRVAATARGDAYLGGAAFGPIDAYALVLLRWGSMSGLNPEDCPTLWAHVQRVAALPAVARVLERERVPLNAYTKAPQAA